MSKFQTIKTIATVIVLAASVAPAMADNDDNRNENDRQDRQERQDHQDRQEHRREHHKQHWQNRENRNNREEAREISRDSNVTTTVYPSDWNGQRVYFSNNWSRRNPDYAAADRAALELQMKNSWNAYHKNSYNGSYDWNTYNNPEFFDYVHTNNPSLFTQIRSYISN